MKIRDRTPQTPPGRSVGVVSIVGHLDGRRGWHAETLGERDLGVAFSGQDIFQVKRRLDRLLAGE